MKVAGVITNVFEEAIFNVSKIYQVKSYNFFGTYFSKLAFKKSENTDMH